MFDVTGEPRSRRGILRMAALMGAAAAAAFVLPPPAQAQDYPSKSIRLVYPYDPGGAGDAWTRRMSEVMTRAVGQSIVVDYVPGTAGVVGSAATAQAAPDGYTMMVGTISTHAVNTVLLKDLPYDPVRDFAPISLLAETGFVIVVNNDTPYQTFEDLLAAARAEPGKLNAGIGTASHRIAVELLKQKAGIDVTNVQYRSGTLAVQDLIAGRVDLMAVDTGAAKQFEGQFRILASASKERLAAFPDIPAGTESGLDGFEMAAWTGFFFPAGVPDDILEKMGKVAADAARSPEFQELMANYAGVQVVGSTPAEFKAYVEAEVAKMKDVAAAAGIEAQ